MFHLSILVKPQSAAFEITEKEVREAAVKALVAAGSRSVTLPDCISTDTRSVITHRDNRELMKAKVEIIIFTSAPDWIALSIDNKMKKFIKKIREELRYLKDGELSVFVVNSQHFSA